METIILYRDQALRARAKAHAIAASGSEAIAALILDDAEWFETRADMMAAALSHNLALEL